MSNTESNAKSTFVKYKLADEVVRDIEWWRTELSKEVVSLKIIEPPPMQSEEIFVDASTGWGIGFTYKGRWLAWKYIPSWFCEGRCIRWGETVAIELALRTLIASGVSNTHIKLRSDNQGVIGALAAGRSYNIQENTVLQHILRLFDEHSIWLRIEWIPSEENPADAPSRGTFAHRSKLYPNPPKIPYYLRNYISHSVKYNELH